LKTVPLAKLFVLLSCAAPLGNTRLSPASGATSPTQFAAVVQLLSEPPPSQVSARCSEKWAMAVPQFAVASVLANSLAAQKLPSTGSTLMPLRSPARPPNVPPLLKSE